MKWILATLLLLASSHALACSCRDIRPLEDVIAASPILVEAKVIRIEYFQPKQGTRLPVRAHLAITRTLRGIPGTRRIVLINSMCYSSVYIDLMAVDDSYVLPLMASLDGRHYHLAGCAKSGLKLENGKLYDYATTTGKERRLLFHGRYADFLRRYATGR